MILVFLKSLIANIISKRITIAPENKKGGVCG